MALSITESAGVSWVDKSACALKLVPKEIRRPTSIRNIIFLNFIILQFYGMDK
jgi:hypothetical protein